VQVLGQEGLLETVEQAYAIFLTLGVFGRGERVDIFLVVPIKNDLSLGAQVLRAR